MLICKNCGNTEEFQKTVYGTVGYEEDNLYDNEGGLIETLDTDYNNYNTTTEDDYRCANCGSDNIEETDVAPEPEIKPVSIRVTDGDGNAKWKETYKQKEKIVEKAKDLNTSYTLPIGGTDTQSTGGPRRYYMNWG